MAWQFATDTSPFQKTNAVSNNSKKVKCTDIVLLQTNNICVFPKIGVFSTQKWMVYFMEHPMNKWMIWVVKPHIFGKKHPYITPKSVFSSVNGTEVESLGIGDAARTSLGMKHQRLHKPKDVVKGLKRWCLKRWCWLVV